MECLKCGKYKAQGETGLCFRCHRNATKTERTHAHKEWARLKLIMSDESTLVKQLDYMGLWTEV